MTPKLSLLTTVVLVVVLCLYGTGVFAWLGLELTELLQQFKLLHEARARGVELDRINEKIKRQMQVKAAVIDQLLGGRTTLPQAAGVFLSLAEDMEVARPRSRAVHGATPEERACREVIDELKATLENYPERGGPDLVEQLEAELADLLAHPGGLRLPAVKEVF
jgi:hypothetical protein